MEISHTQPMPASQIRARAEAASTPLEHAVWAALADHVSQQEQAQAARDDRAFQRWLTASKGERA